MRIPLLLCLLLAAAAAPAQGYKAVKRWAAGCDNTRHCSAIGFAPEDAQVYAMLHFERGGAGSDTVTRMTLRADQGIERGRSFVLRADDAELLQFAPAQLVDGESGPGIDIVIDRPDDIAAVLGALRGVDTLSIVGDGEVVAVVSASGASAILLWIDEQQQRLGTATAFVRRGEQPADSVPPPPPAPRVIAQPGGRALDEAEALRLGKLVRETLEADTCEDSDPDRGQADSAWGLADGRTLVQLGCYAGAYNFGSSWFLLAQGQAPQMIAFPVPADDGSGRMSTTGDLVNAGFDPATGLLGMFSKGRGIGDCGASGEWAWTGARFELLGYSMMHDCQGVSADFWPQLWRAQR